MGWRSSFQKRKKKNCFTSKESHSHTPFIVMEAYGFLSLVIKKKMKTLDINSKK